jgi:ABC-type proline/glycine betaine transport system ATPase subunit
MLVYARSVFLREECPHILLLDETFAPLDPLSKAEVQGMLTYADVC